MCDKVKEVSVARREVCLFDFDGTLTTRDTLIEFIRYAHGSAAMVWGFALHAPLLVLMKLGLYANYRAKQRVFTHFFRGMCLERFDTLCEGFAREQGSRLLRPAGMCRISKALDDGAEVLVVSASIDNWVKPFFKTFGEGQVTVVGTQIETRDGRLTGRFLSPNCYGPEKVRRVKEILTLPRHDYHITAYGDSRGDQEMLDYADEAHYRPFRL